MISEMSLVRACKFRRIVGGEMYTGEVCCH